MKPLYFNVTVIAEWFAFIAALLLLDKKTSVWRLFILLLLLTLCTETIGWYMHHEQQQNFNALPFNLLMLVSNTFFIWFFKTTKFLKKESKQLNYLTIGFIVFGLVNLLFFQGLVRYNSFSETLGDIIISLISCYLLFTLVKDNDYIDLLQFDYFWLATGLLFYSMGSALVYHFSYLLNDYQNKSKINIGIYINYSLNLMLYTSLIIAFICRRKITR